jgi:hypothetical protein
MRAKERNARLEDEADARAIHAYLMKNSEAYHRAAHERSERFQRDGGIGTRSLADDVGEAALTFGGSLAFRVVVKGSIGAFSSQGLRALWADTAGGGPNPFLTARTGLFRGLENIRTFGSLNEARAAAREMAGLGDDTVKYISEVGPMRGQVVGSSSRDGLRGWRIDFDKGKGYHVNWWDKTGGNARSTWWYGANQIEGGTYGDFLFFLQHLQ